MKGQLHTFAYSVFGRSEAVRHVTGCANGQVPGDPLESYGRLGPQTPSHVLRSPAIMVEKAWRCSSFPSEMMHHCTVQRSTAPAAEKVSGLPQLAEQWSTITFSLSEMRKDSHRTSPCFCRCENVDSAISRRASATHRTRWRCRSLS
jgi:hypothetical protein